MQEIVSGKIPYYEHKCNAVVMKGIVAGFLPTFTFKEVIHGLEAAHVLMMERTWTNDASQRPTMAKILRELVSLQAFSTPA